MPRCTTSMGREDPGPAGTRQPQAVIARPPGARASLPLSGFLTDHTISRREIPAGSEIIRKELYEFKRGGSPFMLLIFAVG
jgi:hypothetical protein